MLNKKINNKIIDISWPISIDMTSYKDKKPVSITQTRFFEKDNLSEHDIKFNTHTGTHIDSPSHFLPDSKSIDQLSLEKVIGTCQVIDFTNIKEKITRQDLEEKNIKPNSRLLFKTKNSFLGESEKFNPNFIYLDKSGAQYLSELKTVCVGIDYLGIERDQPEHESHKILLQKAIPIIEGLRLGHVEPGEYKLICLPILLKNKEAAPARAVLIPQ